MGEKCAVCNGTGFKTSDVAGHPFYMTDLPCPACEGTGKVGEQQKEGQVGVDVGGRKEVGTTPAAGVIPASADVSAFHKRPKTPPNSEADHA